MQEINGIITADWHGRKDKPPCRPESEEEWIDFQIECFRKVIQYSVKNNIPVFHNGDLFHRSNPMFLILGTMYEMFWEEYGDESMFFKIAGNHDLPYNSMDNVKSSGWYVFPGLSTYEDYPGASDFGEAPEDPDARIIFTHQLTWPSEKEKPSMAGGKTAADLLEEYPNAEWIFTGDYHKHFHYEEDGRHVVNPGCLTRQSVGEKDYTPGFYVVDTARGKVKFVKIGDTVELNTAHLIKSKERDERIEAFISSIEGESREIVTFTETLEKKLLNKKISTGVRKIITEIKEEIGV